MAETAARGERRASERADRAVTRLNDVASGTIPVLVGDGRPARPVHGRSTRPAVGRLCRLLAAELGWSPEDVALAHMTGLVHDIGKVGLPDEVLRKPGRPTTDEWDLIRRHPDWGADALAADAPDAGGGGRRCAATTSGGTAAATPAGCADTRSPRSAASWPCATRTTR